MACKRQIATVFVAVAAFFTAVPAPAQTWTGTVSGSWNTAGNWSPAGVPTNSRNTQLTFAATTNGVMTNDIPATLSVFTLNQLTFTAAAPAYSLAGDALSFMSSTGGAQATIVMNSTNSVTIADPIQLNSNLTVSGTGTGTVTLSGTISGIAFTLADMAAGTLTLTGNNTYTGPTAVSGGGVLAVPSIANGGVNSPLGASSNAVGNLTLGSSSSRGDLLLTGTNANYSTDRGVTVVGNFVTSPNYGGGIDVQNAGTTLTWNGQITSAANDGTFYKTGAGTLVLTNPNNNYALGTVVLGGALVVGANGSVIPAGLFDVFTGARIILSGVSNTPANQISMGVIGGTLTATGSGNYYLNALDTSGGTVDLSGSNGYGLHITTSGTTEAFSAGTTTWVGGPNSAIYNDSPGSLSIYIDAGSPPNGVDLDCGITLSAGGANPNFTKSGPGVMRLTSLANTGNITVSAGILRVDDMATGGVGALGAGAVTLNGGTLLYAGPTATSAKPLTLTGGGGNRVSTAGANLTLTGVISESAAGGQLSVLGNATTTGGTLTLSAANTYTGPTSVTGFGILAVPSITNGGIAGPLGAASNAPANLVLGSDTSPGTLLYTGMDASPSTDRGVTLGGTLSYTIFDGGTIGVQNAATNLTMSGQFTGGTLFKTGPGMLTLTNPANNYTQETNVFGGTLIVASGGAIPANTPVSVVSGATLQIAATASNTAGTAVEGISSNPGSTVRIPAGSPNYYLGYLGFYGGVVDFTGSTNARIVFTGYGATVLGNTTWTGGGTSGFSTNGYSGTATIYIHQNVTLTSTALLYGQFTITGGGTYYAMGPANGAYAPLTVSQARVRVDDLSVGTDGSSVLGLNGNGSFTLDGGTLQYSGPTQSSPYLIVLGAGGGTVEVSNAATTLTLTGLIYSFTYGPLPGPLTKAGPGVLAITNTDTSLPHYAGGIIVNGGRLDISDDAQLGLANPVVNQFGTLRYTASTTSARTFTMNSGTLEAPSGVTLTLNGAAVGGGFLAGQGTFAVTGGTALTGVTTYASTNVSVTGAASFTNFTNGSLLSVAASLASPVTFTRFTNQGSGSITVGAVSVVNVSDFQTYGTLTLNPAVVGSGQFTELVNVGGSPLYFNGGSRTFLGTPQTANFNGSPAFVAGIDLHGNNAVIAGGLFVNNGFVVDLSTGGTPGSVIVDYGALYKGAGYTGVNVITQNGGKVQAGNSPGSASFGRFVFGPGGVNNYVFPIDDATGTAGPSPDAAGHVSGWGLVKAVQQSVGSVTSSGDFTWTATPTDKLTFAIDTLINPTTVGTDIAGAMADFDPTRAYSWPAAHWAGTYSGPTDAATLDAATSFDTSGFLNPTAGTFGWSLDPADQTLSLIYTPSSVPEPGTLALVGLAAAGLAAFRGRRRRWLAETG